MRDGESMTPEPQSSEVVHECSRRHVVSDLIGDDPDASCAVYDLLIGGDLSTARWRETTGQPEEKSSSQGGTGNSGVVGTA
jgi:hypothetical protein